MVVVMIWFQTDAARFADAYYNHAPRLALPGSVFLFRKSNTDFRDGALWRARGVGNKRFLIAAVEVNTLGVATVGRGGYGEAAVIGGFTAFSGGRLSVGLKGTKFLFGSAMRAEKDEGGYEDYAQDYQGDKGDEKIGRCGA